MPKYHLKDAEENAGVYGVMQQRPLSYHFDTNTIQLRQDDAKLVASTYGTDPSNMRIGLTAHHMPSPTLNNDIVDALVSLITLASKNHTLHKWEEGAKNDTPAYNPNDWICIGKDAILAGKSASKLQEKTYTFIEMYNSYLQYIGTNDIIWGDFCKLFEKNIKIGKARQIWEDNSISCIMSKHTYTVLYTKWKECRSKTKKRR